jgi:hypothetical protein
VQEHCEAPLLQDEQLRRLEGGRLERLTIWAACYDPDGAVHHACCRDVCMQLKAARASGLLEAVAREERCCASVIAGLYVSLDEMVKHAMETGVLDGSAAGLSLYPTGL